MPTLTQAQIPTAFRPITRTHQLVGTAAWIRVGTRRHLCLILDYAMWPA